MRPFICAILAAIFPAMTSAQSILPAVFTDPPADAAHPARMTVLHIPTHGVQINGLVYQPSVAGPHPTLVICHGLPGIEAQGGRNATAIHVATDHAWSDHRIALESTILTWLAGRLQ